LALEATLAFDQAQVPHAALQLAESFVGLERRWGERIVVHRGGVQHVEE
jgi:hypothetical protein